MKYFITANGLEPFDMCALELVKLLADDTKNYTTGRKRKNVPLFDNQSDKMIELIYAVNDIILDESFIFKHPDMSMQEACDVITDRFTYMDHYDGSKWYHTYPKEMDGNQYYSGSINIVKSIISNDFNYKISHLCIVPHRLNSLLRKLTIDSILEDLAQ